MEVYIVSIVCICPISYKRNVMTLKLMNYFLQQNTTDHMDKKPYVAYLTKICKENKF